MSSNNGSNLNCNGKVVNALCVADDEEVMLLTDGGTLVRTRVNEISKVGRNTQGVRLINLAIGEHLIGMQSIPEIEEDEAGASMVEASADKMAPQEHNASGETPKDSEVEQVQDLSPDDLDEVDS